MTTKTKPAPAAAPAHPTIAGALAAAILDAAAVEKTSRNDFHRYAYASAEAILAEARGALAKHGLVATWSARTLDMQRAASIELAGRRGAQTLHIYAILVGVVRVSHAHSDGALDIPVEWPVCLEPGKNADKAVAAAQTSALSYVLRDVLLLPRVAEGEDIQARHDEVEPREAARGGKPRAEPTSLERLEAQGWDPDSITKALNEKYGREEAFSYWATQATALGWLAKNAAEGLITMDQVWGDTARQAAERA